MDKKENNVIAFMVNSKYYFALGTTIVNILNVSKNDYYFVVYEYDLTEQQKSFLIDLTNNRIRFIRYTFEEWVTEHKLAVPSSVRAIERYTHLAFSKHKIFELLKEYHKVLFLDVDILILGGIDELFNETGVVVTGSKLNYLETFRRQMGSDLFDKIDQSPIKSDDCSVNAGVLYVEDSCDYNNIYSSAVDFMSTCVNNSEPKTGLDELVFMYSCFANNVHPKRLDRKEYNSRFFQNGFSPKIIHFAGALKPWNAGPEWQLLYPDWYKYYDKWCELGGSPYSELIKFTPKSELISGYLSNIKFIEFLKIVDLRKYNSLKFIGVSSESPNLYTFDMEGCIFDIRVITNNYPKTPYVFGFKVLNKKLLADSLFITSIERIAKANNYKIRSGKSFINIYTPGFSGTEVPKQFNYFIRQIEQLLM